MTFASLTADTAEALKRCIGTRQPRTNSSQRETLSGNPAMSLSACLAQHDPAHVGLIETQLRNLVADLVGKYDPGILSNLRLLPLPRFSQERETAKANLLVASRPEVALALSTHRSGFVREIALRHVRSIDSAFEFALVLRRMNDWVPEVRSAAVELVERSLFSETADTKSVRATVSGCLELLLSANELGRADSVSRRVLDRLLTDTGCLDELSANLMSGRQNSAPKLLKQALKRALVVEHLPGLALGARHPAVRRVALKALLDGRFVWKAYQSLRQTSIELAVGKDELAETGLRDRSVEVQDVALQYIVNTPDSRLNREETFRGLLSSRHPCLTDKASFGLARLLGKPEIVAECSDLLLSEPEPPIWAARILARYGNTRDHQIILAGYERLSLRPDLVWLDLLAKLEDVQAIETLLDIAVHHPDLACARQASRALESTRLQADVKVLAEVMRRGKGEFHARKLRHIAGRCSAIDIVRLILLQTRHDPEADREPLWVLAGRKIVLGVFNPLQSELDALKSDLVSADPDLRDRVEDFLWLSRFEGRQEPT
ncbi:hypothetical protein [Labrenzia sp. VG12]|uniref:hypothetical protein n=1 Tax=Labrenzia sp. VG12 TaxID=2021862 RepID=UPI0012FDB1F8|nr:hypothetical protein [Labrenzia sp. VG12]